MEIRRIEVIQEDGTRTVFDCGDPADRSILHKGEAFDASGFVADTLIEQAKMLVQFANDSAK